MRSASHRARRGPRARTTSTGSTRLPTRARLEHFLHRALPPRHPSVPPPPNSSRPPPITVDSSAGAMPSATVPGRGCTPPTPCPRRTRSPCPRCSCRACWRCASRWSTRPRWWRERGHVAVIAGRLSVPSSVPAARQIVHMVGEPGLQGRGDARVVARRRLHAGGGRAAPARRRRPARCAPRAGDPRRRPLDRRRRRRRPRRGARRLLGLAPRRRWLRARRRGHHAQL